MRVPSFVNIKRIKRAALLLALLALLALLVPLATPGVAWRMSDAPLACSRSWWAGALNLRIRGRETAFALRITNTETDQPVEDAERTLKAEILNGAEKREISLRGVFDGPGHYTSDIIPTKAGDYRFRIFGSIEGQQVNETFDSADKKFDAVLAADAIQFPAAATATSASAAGNAAPAQNSGLGSAVTAAQRAALAAQVSSDAAQTLGVAGAVLGVIGILLGGAALLRSRKPSPKRPTILKPMNSGVVRGTVRLLAVVGASVVCLLAVAGVVGAHAYLDHAEPPVDSVVPSAPDDLRLWFTEPLEPKFSNVRVLDASGNRMDNDDSQVDSDDLMSMSVSLQPLPNGAYTVAWVALSTLDGHVTRGFYSLSVGVAAMAKPGSNLSETSVYTPWEAASRWLGYLGVLLLLGTVGFRLLVLRPVLQTEGLAPVLLPAASAPRRSLAVDRLVAPAQRNADGALRAGTQHHQRRLCGASGRDDGTDPP